MLSTNDGHILVCDVGLINILLCESYSARPLVWTYVGQHLGEGMCEISSHHHVFVPPQ